MATTDTLATRDPSDTSERDASCVVPQPSAPARARRCRCPATRSGRRRRNTSQAAACAKPSAARTARARESSSTRRASPAGVIGRRMRSTSTSSQVALLRDAIEPPTLPETMPSVEPITIAIATSSGSASHCHHISSRGPTSSSRAGRCSSIQRSSSFSYQPSMRATVDMENIQRTAPSRRCARCARARAPFGARDAADLIAVGRQAVCDVACRCAESCSSSTQERRSSTALSRRASSGASPLRACGRRGSRRFAPAATRLFARKSATEARRVARDLFKLVCWRDVVRLAGVGRRGCALLGADGAARERDRDCAEHCAERGEPRPRACATRGARRVRVRREQGSVRRRRRHLSHEPHEAGAARIARFPRPQAARRRRSPRACERCAGCYQ